MYSKSLEAKIVQALQSKPEVLHSELLVGLEHGERLAMLDTVREMARNGLLKRDISQKDANGRMILRYLRVG
jgi:hypothetical protein